MITEDPQRYGDGKALLVPEMVIIIAIMLKNWDAILLRCG